MWFSTQKQNFYVASLLKLNKWMDGWMAGQTNDGWLDERMDDYIKKNETWKRKWMDGWMQVHKWIEVCMHAWMNECTNTCMHEKQMDGWGRDDGWIDNWIAFIELNWSTV